MGNEITIAKLKAFECHMNSEGLEYNPFKDDPKLIKESEAFQWEMHRLQNEEMNVLNQQLHAGV